MRFSFSLLCLFFSSLAVGQAPVANFSASVVSGCSPVVVVFTDQSTGSPKLWNWDFGNGQLSNLQNPQVSFSKPGTYSITLVVKNTDGVDGITKTNYITVNPSPSVAFLASSTLACAPATIQFTDNSVANAGNLVQWKWTFSDGTTYNSQNVSKQFTTPGYYDVSLSVASSTGCTATAGTNRLVRIVPGLKVDFVNTDPSTCRAPFPVNFINQTSGPGNIIYNWDFGNATSSTQSNASTQYNSPGTYTVNLSAQSSLGCQGNIQKTITVAGKTTSFNAPLSTCLNSPVNFQNTSAPLPVSVLWDFGDGSQSTELNPAKAYNTPGNYTVKLIATFSNCTDSAIKTITVLGKPPVNFTATKTGACSVPVLVNFQNTSPDAVTAIWDFGDGSPTSSTPSHTYIANGKYDVTLTITDSKGCQNTITKPGFVEISAPLINITNSPAGGCGPTFRYTPNATITTADGVASYAWDFGDRTPVDNSATPTHTYTNFGNYPVKLTITTNGGCTAVGFGSVSVGNGVTVDFTKDAPLTCSSSGVHFTDLTTPAVPGLQWVWDFGDGDTSHQQNPFHKYKDTIFYNVTLTVINNGCITTGSTKINFVHPLPPIAVFTDSLDCVNKRTVKFTNKSIDNIPYTYTWKFGDPAIPDQHDVPVPVVNYTGTGPYSVQLIVQDKNCKDTATKTLSLINEPASFTVNKINACQKDSIHFKSLNTPAYIKTYAWTVNGIAAGKGLANFDTSFATFGNYSVALTVTDINGCISSKTTPINITGPTAAFRVANKGGCLKTPVVFTDASLPVGGIRNWSWNFGDGTVQNFATGPFTHVYNDTGSYNIKLVVTDTIGCTDTITRSGGARINRVKVAFSAERTITCPGIALQFTDSSYDKNSSYTYNWSFGDGNTSIQKNPANIYTGKDSSYTVKLVVRDTSGCADSLTLNNYIKVLKPKAAFGVKDSTTICPPLQTQFFFKGKDYESVLWDFGDGGSSVLTTDPLHFYNEYGSFKVKLYLTGYGGCLDSASSIVNIYNPAVLSSINYPDTTVCNSLLVNFTLKTPPSTHFYFYFGDGGLDTSQNLHLQHFYGIPSYYAPSLFLTDSQNCQVSVGAPYLIRILGALPLFSKDKKTFCDSSAVFFTNFTIANDPIISQLWDFGDGNTSTNKDVSNFYKHPGFFTPSLTVKTQAGCVNTTKDTILVLGTPHPFINSVDAVCNNFVVNFNGNLRTPDTAITWKWDFGNGQTSAQQNQQILYPAPGTYAVKLKTSNSLGCSDTTSKTVVVNPLPGITISGDTSIIVGTGITVPIKYSPGVVSFNWAPSTGLSCVDCANPYANPKFTTTYKVSVVDGNGCVSSRNITLVVLCNNRNFFVPNTFSPNGDGNNDRFYPRGTGLDHIEGMRIFNRWGELVFEKKNFPANDAASGWDGTFKGKPAGMDTYIYLIDIICENGAVITYKGDITLIR